MKNYLFYLVSILAVPNFLLGQSNDCSSATVITPSGTPTCAVPTNGTTVGATLSFAGCAGTADDDVWYQFTATSATHTITIGASVGFDPVLQVLSGSCASLVSIVCRDFGFSGENETANLTGLIIGSVYRIRVYSYANLTGQGTFTICVSTPPPPPVNNNCAAATLLSVNTACVTTAGSTINATNTGLIGCAGDADDDVWYRFVATNSVQTITATPTSTGFDAVVQLYSGTCAGLTSEVCQDLTFSDDPEVISAVGLIPGVTYYVRVYDYYNGNNGTFNICVTGPLTSAPTNDNPCSAIALPAVNSDCNYLNFTTTGATTTLTPGAPSACAGGGAPMTGGFTSPGTKDVWFSITVPSTGKIYITALPNTGAGSITDGVMALYSGTCGALTQISCSDDHTAYPSTANDAKPFIAATGLTPGATVYLRYYGFGSSFGTFGLCVTTTSNDNCANALYICDVNGYAASTSAAYTPDRPSNMRGNAEVAGTYVYTPGTNTGGIFGQAGPWGTGSSAFNVQINNNSWIRFTASATTAVLNVSILDCWVGNYPSGGVQMQIFSSTGPCTNFTPVSNFQESSTGFTITANGLIVGNDYYLMVDGFAGDICNYTISAQSGVLFPNIPPVSAICSGSSVVLTAPAGATAYDWYHNGSTSQSVTVTPGITQEYLVDVFGLCGNKQTLSTVVTVNQVPNAPLVASTITVCAGQTINLSASAVAGATYSWSGPGGYTSSLQNPTRTGATLTMAGAYTVTVTVNGCTSSAATSNVVVNSIPTSPVVTSNSPVCQGQTINLFSNSIVGASYNWSGPSSFSSTLEDPSRTSAVSGFAGTYNLSVTVGGCTSGISSTVVVVNPLPSAPSASNNGPICSGNTLSLNATNIAGASYSWTGPNSFTSTVQNPSISGATTAASGTYNVSATVNGCTSSTASTTVIVRATPATPAPTSNSPICAGGTILLSGPTVAGAIYTWSGPNSFSSSLEDPSISGATSINAGVYSLIVSVLGCNSGSGSTASVLINTPVSVDAGSNLASCNGSAISLSGIIGGSATSSTWSGGSGSFSNAASLTSSYTPSAGDIALGTVTLTLSSNDPSGPCPSATDMITLTISSSPNANFGYSNVSYCQSASDPMPIYPMGSSGGSFSSTAGLSINSGSGAVDVSSSTPGTYTVTNNISASGSCPSANATNSITIVATPSVPALANIGTICTNGTISLNASTIAGGTYLWTGPDLFSSTSQNTSIFPATSINSGTYSLIVTVNGCPSSATTTNVNVVALPNVAVVNGLNENICPNGNVSLTATGATSYTWSPSTGLSATSGSNVLASPLTTQNYTVLGTDANGCQGNASISVSILVPPSLTINPIGSPSNCDSPTGSLIGLGVNGTPTLSYNWINSSNVSVGVNPDLSNIPADNYSVEVTDGNGCLSSFGPFVVSNFATPAVPSATIANTLPCLDGTIEGSISSVLGASYNWTGPNSFSTTNASFIIDPINSSYDGNYCATITINGCTSPANCILVTTNPLPIIDLSASNNDTLACIGENLNLNANGGTSYTWSGPNGFAQNGANVTILGANENQNGYYVVTGTNGNNCSSTDSINISIVPNPVVVISTDVNPSGIYCSGSTASVTATGGNLYTWTGPNGYTNFNNILNFNPILNTDNGTYNVSVTDVNGCITNASIDLAIGPDSFGEIQGDTVICPKSNLTLTAIGGESYSWSGPNGFVSTNQIASITNAQNINQGLYTVIITNADGCNATQEVNVIIQFDNSCLNIPELVTPDADGHNDSWDINGLSDFPNAQVAIFNRWGNLIYQVKPYNTPWTGEPNEGLSIDGKDGKVPFGTYYYIIELNDPEKTIYKGFLELQY